MKAKLLAIALLISLLANPALAALTNATAWEVRTAGSDNNGGAFAVGVGSKDVNAAADLVVDATNNLKVTSITHSFVSGDVNKFINVTAGTGWTAGYYQIVSVASNAAILDHSPAAVATTGGTYNLYSAIDYTQQSAAQVAIDNSTITTSITGTTVTFTGGHTATAAEPGNHVHFLTGTNITAGFYEILSVTSTTWTLDRTPVTSGTTTNATGNMGGALATFAGFAAGYVGGNKIFIKADGTYTTTATVTLANGANNPHVEITGYTSTRRDGGKATLQLSTNTGFYGLTLSGTGIYLHNLTVDCNSLGTSGGITITGSSNYAYNNKVMNCANIGINAATSTSYVIGNEVTGMITGGAGGISAPSTPFIAFNYVHDGATTGITSSSAAVMLRNIVANMSGATSDGILNKQGPVLYNTVYNCGRHGINSNSDGNWYTLIALGNLLVGNGGYGISGASASQPAIAMWDGNAFYNNTLGTRTLLDDTTTNKVDGVYPYKNVYDVVLIGDPFTNAAGGDFSLNNTAGAGANARGAGVPISFPGASSTVTHPDIGAVQHADPGVITIRPSFGF